MGIRASAGAGAGTWLQNRRLAALLLTFSTTTPAQTIDTTMAHVVIGEPVTLVIRVRAFDLPASQIRPECLSLRLQQGDSGLAIAPLQLQVTPSGDDSTALVHATSPEVVTDSFVTGRLTLSCGAEYVREFTVLSDPPRPARGTGALHRADAASSRQPTLHRSRKNAPPPAARPAVAEVAASSSPASTLAQPAPPASTPAPPPPARATRRSITRAEDPAAAAPAASASTLPAESASASGITAQAPGVRLPESEVQALAQAVLQTLQAQGNAGSSLPAFAAPAGMAASSPAEMLLPWQELREEQRLTRATLAALQARLERTERDVWRDALVAMAVIVGLAMSMLLARIAREWVLPRFTSMGGLDDPASTRAAPRRWGDNDDFNDPGRASPPAVKPPPSTSSPTSPAVSTSAQAAPDMTIHWSPSLSTGLERSAPSAFTLDDPTGLASATPGTAVDSQWPDADFGRPSLGDSLASIELLHELDAHTDSCPVGCVVVLESRLQENSGKCPWILLRLLDLYQQLEQPWNRVRVAAQLETLYNVRLGLDVDDGDEAGSPGDLAAVPGTMAEVQRAWDQEDPAPALSALLLRPTLVEVLGRAAFEEVLLLLSIAHRRSAGAAGASGHIGDGSLAGNTGSLWSDSASVILENKTAPGQPGPLELLAA